MGLNLGKNKVLNKIYLLIEYTFKVFIFLIPSQLAIHFWPKWAYIFGIRIDYFSPTIYLSDILIFVLLILWLGSILLSRRKISIKTPRTLWMLLIFSIVNIAFALNPYLALYKWLKIAEFIILGLFLIEYEKIKIKEWIILPLSYSVIFFTFLGIAQFFKGGTLGGFFYLLGERNFNLATPGISLIDILGREYLRAYSTFPHPNSLAGFMGLSLLFLLLLKVKVNKPLFITTLIFASLGILFSFSKTVFIAIFVIFLVYQALKRIKQNNLWEKPAVLLIITVSLLSIPLSEYFLKGNIAFNYSILQKQNINERIVLTGSSSQIIKSNQILGVGIGNFINALKRLAGKEWIMQPVHNIFILIFAETGIIGLIIAYLFIMKLFRNSTSFILVLFILITGYFDHYWLTIQQNLLIETLVIAMILRKDNNIFLKPKKT